VDIHVGARLRDRRDSLGFPQVLLAEALGTTYPLVHKYGRGAVRMSIDRLYSFEVPAGRHRLVL
jgi:hypothetical protein